MNHSKYMEQVKLLSEESLRYIIKDCGEALKANPDGHKAGHYADEINYCAMELYARNN